MAVTSITPATFISASSEQVSSQLADEVVIMNLKNGTYYGLDEVGVLVWELIQKPHTVEAVRDAIIAEYEVEAGECLTDLLALLQDMHEAGIIEVNHGPAA